VRTGELIGEGARAIGALLEEVLDGAGVALTTLSLHRPSLDDVFFRKTGRSLRETAP